MNPDRLIAQGIEEIDQLLPGVEALGIELVGDNALFRVGDDFAGDDAAAVFRQGALAADKVLIVNPFPASRLEVIPHPLAIHHIEKEESVRSEQSGQVFQDRLIVGRLFEITEGIAHEQDRVELLPAHAEFPRVALVKRYV